MKVAIVAPSAQPYAVGGAEKLWWGLLDGFRRYTSHEVELLKIPSPERDFAEVIASYRRFAELDLGHFDLLISTKYPAWMVPHHNHQVYLQHKLRGLYDTYPAGLPQQLQQWPERLAPLRELLARPPTQPGRAALFAELEELRHSGLWQEHFALPSPLARQVVHWLDDSALQPGTIRKFMAISANVAARKDYFPANVPVQVIHHPSDLEPPTHPAAAAPLPAGRGYLFTVSRLEHSKRVDLLINAMQRVSADIELWIAGSGPEQQRLSALAAADPRIRLLGRVADAELRHLYANALAVLYAPADEDYGLVTVEALQAGKPVLSCTDSGGVAELIEEGANGWLCPPQAKALAERMQQLAQDPALAEAMRPACLQRGNSIHWPGTMAALLDGQALLDRAGYTERGKPRSMVVAVSFPVYPPRSGGQNRIYHLYRHIAALTPVTLVTLCGAGLPPTEMEIAPGLTEIRVPKTARHQLAEAALEAELGVSVGDIYAIGHIEQTPQYLLALREACREADLVVASHPYLFRAIKAVYRGAVYYESHNVEADMKAGLLAGQAAAQPWLQAVSEVERECGEQALGIAVCSADDARRMRELYQWPEHKLVVAPNGLVTGRPVLSRAARPRLRRRLLLPGRPTALFLGSWHGPNLEAVEFILEKLAPALPQVDFWLLGGVCDAWRGRALPANVRSWGGNLDETGKWALLQAADLALNPAASGAGSSLKMLEYAVAGLPVLSTRHGCRGLAPELVQHLHTAELEEFEKKLRNMVNLLDSDAFEHTSAKALRASADSHDWQGIAKFWYGQLVSSCSQQGPNRSS
ncbi:MAG: glycosyltransferase [Halieaceae bacterium]|nr:glycosyltransferase [Halieaceae bacterium]